MRGAGICRASRARCPRADALFALPRQRFDTAGSRLRGALFQNLQRHRAAFVQAAALLRPRIVASEIATCRDNLGKLETGLFRGYRHRVRGRRNSLDGCVRVLESLSYRAILEPWVRADPRSPGRVEAPGDRGRARRELALIFADGETRAVATKDKPIRARETGPGRPFLSAG